MKPIVYVITSSQFNTVNFSYSCVKNMQYGQRNRIEISFNQLTAWFFRNHHKLLWMAIRLIFKNTVFQSVDKFEFWLGTR